MKILNNIFNKKKNETVEKYLKRRNYPFVYKFIERNFSQDFN